jgi:hypothetical protein
VRMIVVLQIWENQGYASQDCITGVVLFQCIMKRNGKANEYRTTTSKSLQGWYTCMDSLGQVG